ncbi:helix-turn-helix domain-containing protein [Rhodobium gokarnense]|uniref:Transcriptional regulator/DNA-binding XRE family transcriptional regulator n=1 Tax=Rhodobium gokarnense TaxID=364296 RepID=A0ABT3H705_9HYPH|nr:helix-turn-helix domain-containing protein [Rhodobium gokarnense]MCW2306119.1 putative transcriptional regulator/DNA-binding XRE family transcriptional regulator [Rhodobium gokarnense]
MESSILGTRIRQRRREIGLTQAELARRIGISASYLNLIEWNKRRIAGGLLRRTAEAVDLTVEELDDDTGKRLLDRLSEIAQLPELADVGIEEHRTNEFVGRFPGWAQGMAALAQSEREATVRAQILADRLSNDPFLSETVHRMLTRIAAIRSAAEILSDYPEVPQARRQRFTDIVNEESRTLTGIAEALAAYLDKVEASDRRLTPVDEVEALFGERQNRFAELDAAAAPLGSRLSSLHPGARRDEARALAQAHLQEIVETLCRQPPIETAAARDRARRRLMDYATGAVLMPLADFVSRSADLRYDIEALAEAFAATVESVCLRLTALPPGREVPRFGYFRANAAGTIIEMLGLEGLTVPRYAAACPLWVLYRAQASPEAVLPQRVLFPSGARFVFVARATGVGPTGFGRPRHYVTDMLVMREGDAALTVYAPDPRALVEEVGPSCRLCPRRSCLHRVEDPFAE